jgi:hypothetical protein
LKHSFGESLPPLTKEPHKLMFFLLSIEASLKSLLKFLFGWSIYGESVTFAAGFHSCFETNMLPLLQLLLYFLAMENDRDGSL